MSGVPEALEVLVIDDEQVVCASCRRILEEEGHRVIATQDPEEGIRLAVERRPEVAIVDLKMPKVDGLEVLRRIKQSSPETDVMIVTGFAEIQTAVQAMKLGAFDYVPKPFSPDQLLIAVSKMRSRRVLEAENERLRHELRDRYRFGRLIGGSPAMRRVYSLIEKVAPTDSTVLIRGASGTGKELVARAIHFGSPRASRPFVAVDCASLSESVLESEMFGHVRGAFTGAVAAHKGFFVAAGGGTLFLDEIGDIPLSFQRRLLRVLQEREVRPVGGERPIAVDFRLIAATNRDLDAMVRSGEFREDLYYRIHIVPIRLPELRERADDVPLLVAHFLERGAKAAGTPVPRISAEAMELLSKHDWPGNVRELQNAVQRAVILSAGGEIRPEHLPSEVRDQPAALLLPKTRVPETWQELRALKHRLQDEVVKDLERRFLEVALHRARGNATRAAEAVGMLRPNFQALMKRHGVRREAFLAREGERRE